MNVRFHAISAGGDGVGRDEAGRVVFAPYAAPGDIAQVNIRDSKSSKQSSFARGEVQHLIEASPERVTPPCPFFGPAPGQGPGVLAHDGEPTAQIGHCGGCQIQHVAYAAQLEAKRLIVRDALARIGGMGQEAEACVAPCVASPQPFAYRNKADLVVTVPGNGNEAQDVESAALGFFARESHDVVDITHCMIQGDANNLLLQVAREAVLGGLVEPFDARTGRGILRRLVLRTSATGESLLTAVTTRTPWPQAVEFAAWMQQKVPSLVGVLQREPRQEARLVDGRDWLEEHVAGLRLRVTGEGFFQVNSALLPTLVATAMEMAAPREGMRLLDAYCGVGLFSLAAARAGAEVHGVEVSRGAIRDARQNASLNGLPASFVAEDAGQYLRQVSARKKQRWDVVLLDPPRAGAAECVPGLVELKPGRIVYVSCDPATLARDVKALVAAGYRLRKAVPLDMFPQTAHVETVVCLEWCGEGA